MRSDETSAIGAGSCSSLTSSNSDEAQARLHRNSAVANHASLAYNSMAGKQKVRGAPNMLLHSLSTNDATTVGEYKFTVNIGQNNIKITGDSFNLVQVSVIL